MIPDKKQRMDEYYLSVYCIVAVCQAFVQLGEKRQQKKKQSLGSTGINNFTGEIALKQHGDQRGKNGCGPQVILKYDNTP